MNEHDKTQLQEQLSELTRWTDKQPQVWKNALEAHQAEQNTPLLQRKIRLSSLSGRWAAVLLVCVSGFLIAMLMLPNLSRARQRLLISEESQIVDNESDLSTPFAKTQDPLFHYSNNNDTSFETNSIPSASGAGGGVAVGRRLTPNNYGYVSDISGAPASNLSNPMPSADRAVIRKTTIELITNDVRNAFLKVQLLLSQANGEFIEQSNLSGSDENTRASLTIRVASHRLSEVLNQLRELGLVHAESTTGQDVTTQIVDYEARINNERQVEKELLELLESRNKAPLNEILSLRQQLSTIRMQIERLTAQRANLGKLVSLATILVLIKHEAPTEEAPPKIEESSVGDYFMENIQHAWTGSLYFLADSTAFLLKAIVGGLFWWIALLIGILVIRNQLKRRVELGLV